MSVPPTPFATYGTRPGSARSERPPLRHQSLRDRLDCRFDAVDDVFDDCLDEARRKLSARGLDAYLDHARALGKLGRGVEPLLVFLEIWPTVAELAGEASLEPLIQATQAFQKSPNGPAIVPLLQSLGAVARRLRSPELMAQYLALTVHLMRETSISIHGGHFTDPSPSLPTFLQQAPELVGMVPLEGLRRWMSEGIRLHGNHPQRQIEFFRLTTPDSRALLQRERHGTLLVDAERRLDLTLRCLWGEQVALIPYPVNAQQSGDAAMIALPYAEADGFRLPEVLDDWQGSQPAARLSGLERYRAIVAHLAAHRRWSRPQVADNLSPLQRLAVEFFEDCRVDTLALRCYPGLRATLLQLHPAPAEDACQPERESCLRHRLACLSRALLDEAHGYRDPLLLEYRARFHELLLSGESSTKDMVALAVEWAARSRRQSDQRARMRFADTVVDYRDDNRHLWKFIEAGDEEEAFDERRSTSSVEDAALPPRHYPEWDESTHGFRPDWVSVYDHLQPAGDPADIDALLERHAPVARHLKRLLDLLKPQDRTRLRYQEEGTELDLDVAVRAITDWRAGAQPDPRIHMSTRTDGRDIAVLLLVDLSASVNDTVAGTDETVLDVSRAAAALLAWAVSQLGDQLAIAGFHSNTRHEVRYLHIKGFAEAWDDSPKARLAATAGAYSTRMGAALRHAGHLISGRQAEKKLLLVLTDGQPADVDVSDPQHLPADAAHAVRELDAMGLHTHCISLDARADEYVGRIFGTRWTAIDRVEQLPRRLPELFLSLTR
ncbi:MAG: nitric oxide reductase activation protein NorD [Steroidobacterales bacterium]